MNRTNLTRALYCGSLLLAVQGRAALAQTTEEVGALEEVTVTATRQAESIQKVPLSIRAYDQSAMAQLGISDVEDIIRLTPGLDATKDNTGQSVISIRGIYSTVGTATTGIYIDDTPIQVRFLGAGGAAGSAFPTVFDLDRVEVLRGPQGTLFGSGSEGGNIRFITPEPSLTQWSGHSRSELAFNEFGAPSYQFGIAGGGPIVEDELGFRASAYVQHDGGWIDRKPYPSPIVAERNTNSQATEAVNLAFAWAVTDELTVTPSLFYQRREQDSQNEFWANLSAPERGRFVSGALISKPATDRFVLPALKVRWELPDVTVHSNTSYLDRSRDATDDYSFGLTELLTGDFTGPVSLAPAYFSNPQRQFTQEFRLQSADPDSRLRWLVGAFYQRIDQRADQRVVAPGLDAVTQELFGLPVVDLFGADFLPGGVVYLGRDSARDTQLAGFGQADFKLTDTLTATAGIRYSHSKFSYANFQDGPFNSGPSGSSGSSSESSNTPKFALNYQPGDDLMLYASAAKGNRAGGANTPVSVALCGPDLEALGLSNVPRTYESDHVWSYELGSKGAALERRLQWDASAFYVDWSDIQSELHLPGCGFAFIGNMGAAVSKGFDLQVSSIPLRGLVLAASVGYTHAEYSKTVLGASGRPIVSKGDRLRTTPWQAALSLDYSFLPFSNGATAYAHIDGQYGSAYRTGNADNALYDPLTREHESRTFASARAGVRFDSWDVSMFAANLFDSRTILFTERAQGSSLLVRGTFPPRTIGVTATYDF